MATKEAVEKVYTLLAGTRPGADLAKVDVEACTFVLEPIPDEELMKAAVLLAREPGDFLPSAGTLFDRALDLMDDQPPVDEAWALIDKHRRHASLGANNPVKLPPRAAEALRLMGGDVGWPEDVTFKEKDFRTRYEGLRAREKRAASLALPAGRLLDAG